MSKSEAAVSGDVARLKELTRFVIEYGSADKLLREHAPGKDGRCPRCPADGAASGKVKSPCTLLQAARVVKQMGGSKRDR